MTTPRKVHGYEDGDLLAQALRRNGDARAVVDEMAPLVAPDRRLARLTLQLASGLAGQLQALMEMEQVRRSARRDVRAG
jgi:hypothetical protein